MIATVPRGFNVNPKLFSGHSGTADSLSFEQFKEKMTSEFLTGSVIHPALYQASIRLVQDLEVAFGGEVSTPIHDALGWNYTRFGNSVQPTLYAALFKNEDGSFWQSKLSQPRIDDRGKERKYECRRGGGSTAFMPPIPPAIREIITQHLQSPVPTDGSFWSWVADTPQIPIVITEGGKKAECALSQGYIALALFGCTGGYRSKDALGNPVKPYLIPDIERFAVPGRRIVLAFDQDEREKTRRQVGVAIARFGRLLVERGCEVLVATWRSQQGKGLADLVANAGADAWHTAYNNALPLIQWEFTQRLERRLTYPANLLTDIGDLSKLPIAQIEQIPEAGIVGISSEKGTGKTKLLNLLIHDNPKVLSLSHRIALARNLGERLNLTYRSDADKVQGRFISEAGFTQRIVSVVDGLLAIDPAQFTDCDLILDEVTQELRHQLTSATCATDGKRPVILARFTELVRNARRIIVADADLDNAALNYLRDLRGEEQKPYLIRNLFKPEPYDCRFIMARDRTVITADFLEEVATLPQGKVLFVATDSKATSKSLTRLLVEHHPQKRVLLLNSETSGGECERAFTAAPDAEIQHYDIIICSPSLATGVSIECQGIVHRVYGIFTGASSNDGDIAQSLSRVREPVDRVVWVARFGSNRSKISRSANPLEVRHHLQTLSTATVQLIRTSLRTEAISGIEQYDWQSDPHISLYCHLAAAQNRSMQHLRDAVLARIRFEGNHVMIEERTPNSVIRQELARSRQEAQMLEAETLVQVPSLTYLQVRQLEERQASGSAITPEEQAALSKFYLIDFYCLEDLTIDDCLWDNNGRRRGEILNLESLLFPDVALDRSAKSLERQATWNQGYCPWDFSHTELRRRVREQIGLTELLDRARNGEQWCKYDLQVYADRARQFSADIKLTLHFTISDRVSDVQIVHQLLSQLGIILKQQWSRSVPGHEGEKLRVYSLDQAHWQNLWGILQRRDLKRQQFQAQMQTESAEGFGSSPPLENSQGGGDPSGWFGEECLDDVREMLEAAQSDPEQLAAIRESIPEPVLRYLAQTAEASHVPRQETR